MPNSFLLLFTGHAFLGKRQWCTRDNGGLLHYILDVVAPNLKAPLYDGCRESVYEYIEQVSNCLRTSYEVKNRGYTTKYMESWLAPQENFI